MKQKYYKILVLCLSILVGLYCSTASASVQNPYYLTPLHPTTLRLVLTNTYLAPRDSQDDLLGDYAIDTYEGDYSVGASGSSNSYYINGFYMIWLNHTLSNVIGDVAGFEAYFDPITTVNQYVAGLKASAYNNYSVSVRVYMMDQYEDLGIFEFGNVHIKVSVARQISNNSDPDPSSYITLAISSSEYNDSCLYSVNPQGTGIAASFGAALENTRVLNDILDDIVAIKDNDSAAYQSIISYLSTSATALNTITEYLSSISRDTYDIAGDTYSIRTICDSIFTRLGNIKSDTANIYAMTNLLESYMRTFPSYSSQVLQYLGQIAQMSAADATKVNDQASEEADAESKADQIIDDMSYNKPSFGQNDFDFSGVIDSSQSNTFTGLIAHILSHSFFSTMLVMMFTMAIAGFALYGRRG